MLVERKKTISVFPVLQGKKQGIFWLLTFSITFQPKIINIG